jgi:hypothetical protein
LSKVTFFDAWPLIASWLKENRKKGNRVVARVKGWNKDLDLMSIAFHKLNGLPMEGVSDGEEGPDPYQGWDRYPSYYRDGASRLGPRPRGLPSNPPRDNMHGREWRSDDSGDGPALCKALFFEAWPLISEWIRINWKCGNFQIALRMCRLQKDYTMRVALLRLKLHVISSYVAVDYMMPGEPQNPSDPYRGWDSF